MMVAKLTFYKFKMVTIILYINAQMQKYTTDDTYIKL